MTAMTVEHFVSEYSGAPIDDDELLSIAEDVDGEIGAAAKAVKAARRTFDTALEAVGFEVG